MQNINDILVRLQASSVQTANGKMVPYDEVEKILAEQRIELATEHQDPTKPKVRTFAQAVEAAKADEEFLKNFSKPTPGLGRSVAANQPAPPAAVEGVKA